MRVQRQQLDAHVLHHDVAGIEPAGGVQAPAAQRMVDDPLGDVGPHPQAVL
jgi:hypothetical protein